MYLQPNPLSSSPQLPNLAFPRGGGQSPVDSVFIFYFYFLALPSSMQDSGSITRDQIFGPAMVAWSPIHWTAGKSHVDIFIEPVTT